MKSATAFAALLLTLSTAQAGLFTPDEQTMPSSTPEAPVKCVYSGTDGNCVEPVLNANSQLVINVKGQGVAPTVTSSPAQAYALAKRAAIADGYRQIAERVRGVRVEGQDTIKNMMMTQSSIRTSVDAMVRGANIIDTTFKEGLCEVELEIVISYTQFAR